MLALVVLLATAATEPSPAARLGALPRRPAHAFHKAPRHGVIEPLPVLLGYEDPGQHGEGGNPKERRTDRGEKKKKNTGDQDDLIMRTLFRGEKSHKGESLVSHYRCA